MTRNARHVTKITQLLVGSHNLWLYRALALCRPTLLTAQTLNGKQSETGSRQTRTSADRCDKMSGAFYFAIMIGGLVILSQKVEVDAQPTLDGSGSCESSTFDEAVNLIREDLKGVRFIREDLKYVKKHLSSNQLQQSNSSCVSKEDLNTALASLQQRSSAVDTSSLCEYTRRVIMNQTIIFESSLIPSLEKENIIF